jgi:hypothetical protein
MKIFAFKNYFFYVLIVAVTSTPFFIKRFDSSFVAPYAIYMIAVALLAIFICNFDSRKYFFFKSHVPWVFCVLVIAIMNAWLYPGTRLVKNPSTAPSALIEPAKALFYNRSNPYSVVLFDGAPISPGPGWILLNSPFSLNNLIILLTPTYLLIACICIARLDKAHAFFFSLLLLASLNFLQLSIVGHDLQAISLALVSLTLALSRYHANKSLFVIIAILASLVATARAPLVVAPVVMGICLATIDRAHGLKFAMLSTSIAVLVHFIFYIWVIKQGLFYQPLHVFGRALHSGSPTLLGLGVFIWVAFAIFMQRRLTKDPSTWLLFTWVVLSVPFAFVGIGELIREGIFSLKAWAAWEGKGYVMFTLPLLVAGLILSTNQLADVNKSPS